VHGIKIGPAWGFCECGNDLHRSVKDASYIVTRPGLLFYETWRSHTGVDEDYALWTGEGLRTFRWNVVPSSCSVGPEDEDKLTSRQGATSQITRIFTNTAVRISQPPTVVPKRRQETTNRRYVKSQKSATKHVWTYLHWTVRKKLSFMNVLVLTVIQPEAGVRNLLCHGPLWESGENYWPPLTKMYLNT
jgi:hypothetical protein